MVSTTLHSFPCQEKHRRQDLHGELQVSDQMMACKKTNRISQTLSEIPGKMQAYYVIRGTSASKGKLPFLSLMLSVSIINHKSLARVKWSISCSREKTVQCIFARIKGRVLRPVQCFSLRWRRSWWRVSFKLWLIPIRTPKLSDVFYLRTPIFTSMNVIRMLSTGIAP